MFFSSVLLNLSQLYSGLTLSICVDLNPSDNYCLRPYEGPGPVSSDGDTKVNEYQFQGINNLLKKKTYVNKWLQFSEKILMTKTYTN